MSYLLRSSDEALLRKWAAEDETERLNAKQMPCPMHFAEGGEVFKVERCFRVRKELWGR
jgi:hypothetical protein